MVIVFALVPHGTDHYLLISLYLKERHIARGAKRNEKFSHKGAISSLAATERTMCQELTSLPDRLDSPFRQIQVACVIVQLSLQYVIKQALQIFLSFWAENDLKSHAC